MLADPGSRACKISSDLRCLRLPGSNPAMDSAASLANDLRVLVRHRLNAGDNDAIKDASRYGDFILLKPPFKRDTLLLWGRRPCCLFLVAAPFFLCPPPPRAGESRGLEQD